MRAKVEDIPNQLKQVQSTQQAEVGVCVCVCICLCACEPGRSYFCVAMFQKAKLQSAMQEQLGALQTKLSRREAVLESYNGDLVSLNDLRVSCSNEGV